MSDSPSGSKLADYLASHGADESCLDELVHDAMETLASDINNSGIDAQVKCLVEAYGYAETRRLAFAPESTEIPDPGTDQLPAEPSEAELLDRASELLSVHGRLVCPVCGYDGSTEPHRGSEGETFRYLEDIVCWRPVHGSSKSILTLDGFYQTAEAYDDGTNPRIECRNCLRQFVVPYDTAQISWL